MPREDTDNQPSDQDDERFDSFIDEKDDVKRVKAKDQGVVETDDQKENGEIYDGSLELKIDEATEKHDDSVVEEVDHDPWGKEPDYGYQYNEEVVKKEVAAGEGVYTPEGREELVEDDEITSEEAFYMEGRDKVLKRKAKDFTDNPEIQQQWEED
ncbi:MAG: hypothetical protein ACLPI9_01745 [Halobacteriota archaeon]|jgi:hypothetical protein